jgi:hypothetical protein
VTVADIDHPRAVRRGRRRQVVALVVALGLLVAAGRWLTHPQELGPQGSVISGPARVGQPFLAGIGGYPAEGDVVLRDATARVRTNTADVSYTDGLRRGTEATGLTIRVRAEQ